MLKATGGAGFGEGGAAILAGMHVTVLARYPIKGCRGHAMTELTVDRLGVEGDRRLMLVDGRGRFLSQRERPGMATLVPTLHGSSLRVEAPGLPGLACSIDPAGPLRPVQLWDDEIWAVDQGGEAADWFSAAIGERCRLVWFGPGSERPLDPAWSPRPDAETAFADGYPLLLTLEESLADLNRRIDDPVPMNRFRPNVVVAGAPAWSEDGWRGLAIGTMRFLAVKPCARCQVPTTDQETGVRHPRQEPLRTLAAFHTIPGLGAIFGQNLVPDAPGVLRVGDPLHLDPDSA